MDAGQDDAIMRSVRTHRDNPDLVDIENDFLAKQVTDVTLTTLRQCYTQNSTLRAIRLLQQRRRLVINDEYLLHVQNERVVPSIQGHFIDYILCLGGRLGLDAVLPSSTVAVDHTWHADITFLKLFKLWPDTLTQLPFSTTGRMLYLGTRREEDIWIAFPPKSLLDDPNAPPEMAVLPSAPASSKSTALSTEHAHMLVLFFAHIFHQMRYQDIVCTQRYPEPVTRQSVRDSTDIL